MSDERGYNVLSNDYQRRLKERMEDLPDYTVQCYTCEQTSCACEDCDCSVCEARILAQPDPERPAVSERIRRAAVQALLARCDLPAVFRDGSSANLGRMCDDITRAYDTLTRVQKEMSDLGL